jgi:hypothetical protein
LPVDTSRMGPGHISALNWLIALLVAEFAVKPLATLIHELGHAVVALRVAPGPVVVVVGRPSTAFQVLFEHLKVMWSPLPMRSSWLRPSPGGYCKFDQRGVDPRDRMLVGLAGPAATALLVPIFIWATFECAGMPQWIPVVWGLSALGACISLAYNLDPRPANTSERTAATGSMRDGPRALAAYREWRAQRELGAARL